MVVCSEPVTAHSVRPDLAKFLSHTFFHAMLPEQKFAIFAFTLYLSITAAICHIYITVAQTVDYSNVIL